MKLIAQVKLLPTDEQAQALNETLSLANAACNYISEWAWQHETFGQYDIHKGVYHDVRGRFVLSAQVVVRCISKVSDAYKTAFRLHKERTANTIRRNKERAKKGKPPLALPVMQACSFKPNGSIAFDDRILTWYVDRGFVTIWTTQGRLTIPFVCGDRQRKILDHRQGETDLALVDGQFYLLAVCDVEEPTSLDITGVLGVDLGIVNIATDSDGTVYSGAVVNGLRHRNRRLRQRLQKKQTKSAKRLLRHRRRKEARFARDTNHCIAKKIVAVAKDTNRAIALEDLKGIRERTTVRQPQRATHSSWAFFQLGSFTEYKANLEGVPLFWVNPRNTSRECPACGHIDKRNRPTQSLFSCVSCGFSGPADRIAAVNIGGRAAVNLPNAASLTA